MAGINLKNREIQLKIVYYGPGRSGKTSTLECIQKKLAEQAGSRMIKLKSHENRTLFFDFYPVKIAKVKGFDLRVQLYSVPGQTRLQPLRRLVLNGADSIVFVADAMALRRRSNAESFNNLVENLGSYSKRIYDYPLAVQLNKMDLAKEQIPVISMADLRSDLAECMNDGNFIEKVRFYETSASSGRNVMKTLESIIRMTVKRINFDSFYAVR